MLTAPLAEIDEVLQCAVGKFRPSRAARKPRGSSSHERDQRGSRDRLAKTGRDRWDRENISTHGQVLRDELGGTGS